MREFLGYLAEETNGKFYNTITNRNGIKPPLNILSWLREFICQCFEIFIGDEENKYFEDLLGCIE